jgi:hypothetical protein
MVRLEYYINRNNYNILLKPKKYTRELIQRYWGSQIDFSIYIILMSI